MKKSRFLALVIAIAMVLSLLAGCSGSKQAETTTTEPAATSAEVVAEESSTEAVTETETTTEEETTYTKRADDESFTITDMGGREVTFDHAISKAYAANPMGIVLIETMDWDLLGGYSSALSDQQKKFIPEEYWDLPNLGAWSTATPTANIEELVNAGIDVILVTQVMSEKVTQLAENIQSQTGIPTVLISTELDDIADSYTLLGELFNDQERGDELSEYVATELAELKECAANIPEDDKKTIFYSEGADGLETDPSGSFHTETFDFLGLINVADVAENTSNGFVGQTACSLEQVISWNPDYIIRNFSGTGSSENVKVADILADENWQGIAAVQAGQVYQTPALPYNWIDRPPSMIRILGIKWLGNLLYPEQFDYDIKEEAKEFFSFTMNIELTDEQLDNILANSIAK